MASIFLGFRRWFTLLFLALVLTFLFSDNALGFPPLGEKLLNVITELKTAFGTSSAAAASFVMVLAAVKWIASDNDSGARKKAKDAMIHALVGLIIVSMATEIAGMAAV
jgi:hypothetical protein